MLLNDKYIFFWHEYERNGEFSNWYPCRFVVDDIIYFHSEQYMMAQKAKLFHDAEMYSAILREESPAMCKKYGRSVRNFVPEKWDAVKYDVMRTGVYAKFYQDEELRERMLNTGDALFAEASPYDSVWGIGLDEIHARIIPSNKWPGQNLLGRVLCDVRNEIRKM